MVELDCRLNVAWWALRIGLGVGPIITGIDKYFNKLTDWGMYLSPLATKAVEIVAGLVVLSRWTKIGSYIVLLWLFGDRSEFADHRHVLWTWRCEMWRLRSERSHFRN